MRIVYIVIAVIVMIANNDINAGGIIYVSQATVKDGRQEPVQGVQVTHKIEGYFGEEWKTVILKKVTDKNGLSAVEYSNELIKNARDIDVKMSLSTSRYTQSSSKKMSYQNKDGNKYIAKTILITYDRTRFAKKLYQYGPFDIDLDNDSVVKFKLPPTVYNSVHVIKKVRSENVHVSTNEKEIKSGDGIVIHALSEYAEYNDSYLYPKNIKFSTMNNKIGFIIGENGISYPLLLAKSKTAPVRGYRKTLVVKEEVYEGNPNKSSGILLTGIRVVYIKYNGYYGKMLYYVDSPWVEQGKKSIKCVVYFNAEKGNRNLSYNTGYNQEWSIYRYLPQ